MTSNIGYGSKLSAPIITATTTALVASGKCVVDKIFVSGSGQGSASIDIQTAAGVSVHKWTTIALNSADAVLFGISCGPLGIAVPDGLRIVTSTVVTGINLGVAYRSGLN